VSLRLFPPNVTFERVTTVVFKAVSEARQKVGAIGARCSGSETNALIRQMLEFDQSKRPTAADILTAMSSK